MDARIAADKAADYYRHRQTCLDQARAAHDPETGRSLTALAHELEGFAAIYEEEAFILATLATGQAAE
jgi:hypothetical protein